MARGAGLVAHIGPARVCREGRTFAPRGSPDERSQTRVALWTGGRLGAAGIVEGTLNWGGFRAYPAGRGGTVDVGETTTVFVVPGNEQQAAWVSAMLGAPMLPLPEGATAPDRATVVVAVGTDALGSLEVIEAIGAAGT